MTTFAKGRERASPRTWLVEEVFALLKSGPISAELVVTALEVDLLAARNALSSLVHSGRAVSVGGRPYRYGLPGSKPDLDFPPRKPYANTPKTRPVVLDEDTPRRVPRGKGGSGVIAGRMEIRGYRW